MRDYVNNCSLKVPGVTIQVTNDVSYPRKPFGRKFQAKDIQAQHKQVQPPHAYNRGGFLLCLAGIQRAPLVGRVGWVGGKDNTHTYAHTRTVSFANTRLNHCGASLLLPQPGFELWGDG